MVHINHQNNKVRPSRAKYVVRQNPSTGFHAVYSPDGEKVTEWMEREGAAVTRMKQLQALVDKAAKRTHRPCMCCRQSFASEGIHDRLCPPCGSQANSEMAPVQLGRMSGLRRSA